MCRRRGVGLALRAEPVDGWGALQVVVLLRNPFDAMVAERKRKYFGHTGTPSWPQFVKEMKTSP